LSDIREVSACITEDPNYSRLKDYLIASTGLAYYRDRDQYMAELIGRRLSKLGLDDCASYSQRLSDGKEGRDELDALIADLTIGETYFFRDREQFDAIRDVIIPEILDRKQSNKRLRIWSAAPTARNLTRSPSCWHGSWAIGSAAGTSAFSPRILTGSFWPKLRQADSRSGRFAPRPPRSSAIAFPPKGDSGPSTPNTKSGPRSHT
jgi:hypothetical protein